MTGRRRLSRFFFSSLAAVLFLCFSPDQLLSPNRNALWKMPGLGVVRRTRGSLFLRLSCIGLSLAAPLSFSRILGRINFSWK